jgi:hypothetical protein
LAARWTSRFGIARFALKTAFTLIFALETLRATYDKNLRLLRRPARQIAGNGAAWLLRRLVFRVQVRVNADVYAE